LSENSPSAISLTTRPQGDAKPPKTTETISSAKLAVVLDLSANELLRLAAVARLPFLFTGSSAGIYVDARDLPLWIIAAQTFRELI
jgi:hypothetical protein